MENSSHPDQSNKAKLVPETEIIDNKNQNTQGFFREKSGTNVQERGPGRKETVSKQDLIADKLNNSLTFL